ncbi:putative serine protein kinase, PrkA [uncultured Desulfobacterium sp.]|uniref:Putative serine protein kinase, PrkA n=1 Tax=uncultured Desulfobacterium sp. TaxID=201089 RepID=A0A445N410_9BACT|nr:putative serine protein kinase, PrkA [uncultured Desulfobacterium sp.]
MGYLTNDNIHRAMKHITRSIGEQNDQGGPIPFQEFLNLLATSPYRVIRNVFQVFHDMIKHYLGEGVDEYPDDPESIGFVYYDCNRLFVDGSDHPFFADRPFANRLVNLVEALRRGAQQNKIYIFEGPHGCGKSTFLNNLVMKFEEYANTAEGQRFEIVWRLNFKTLGSHQDAATIGVFERLIEMEEDKALEFDGHAGVHSPVTVTDDFIEVPCPSHDNPIMLIPKQYRREFFDDLLENDEFKWRLFTEKAYEWVFRDNPCTICSSLYSALISRVKHPMDIFDMVFARPYKYNRRLGEGISVFNPGDKPTKEITRTNPMLQSRISRLFRDSDQVKYYYSRYASTNNGIYALMDIKTHNRDRLIELHNIVSEGLHKVGDIEENVNSLFIALMNPEDKEHIKDLQSFADRIEYIQIPYVLDVNTEVEIYRNIFGKRIDASFLPRVLRSFARVIISSRLNLKSEAMLEWIGEPEKYKLYCDENLLLLKMAIYSGVIPSWLTEEDRKKFTAKRRRRIIAESEKEGMQGFSGRDSIKIFNEFYSAYAKDKLINMSFLYNFFTKVSKDLSQSIPNGFLDSLVHMYNYTVLQEVKESLYYYNEQQISRDIQNYLFAINFEMGSTEKCNFTGEKLEITEAFFDGIENRLLGERVPRERKLAFRMDTQKEYASVTLPQEILLQAKTIDKTALYETMFDRCNYSALFQKCLKTT